MFRPRWECCAKSVKHDLWNLVKAYEYQCQIPHVQNRRRKRTTKRNPAGVRINIFEMCKLMRNMKFEKLLPRRRFPGSLRHVYRPTIRVVAIFLYRVWYCESATTRIMKPIDIVRVLYFTPTAIAAAEVVFSSSYLIPGKLTL